MGFKLLIFAAAFVGGLWVAGYSPERIGAIAHRVANGTAGTIAPAGSDWADSTA